MNALKLTTLTMLLPFGWAISADAYPQPIERANPSPASSCHMAQRSDTGTAPKDDDVATIKKALGAIEAIQSTSEDHDTHSSPTETCRLEFDPIEID